MSDDSKNGQFMEVQAYDGPSDEDRTPVDVTEPGTIQVGMDGVKKLGAEHYNSWSNDNGHEDRVLSTLQNSYGSPTADLTNVDEGRYSVEVDGIRTSLATAIKLGYVIKDGNGYRDGEPGKTYIPADIKPEVNMTQPVYESVNELRATIGENNANSLLHSAIGSIINEDSDDSPAFNNLGSSLGLEKGDGHTIASALVTDIGGELIGKTAARYGLDIEEVASFMGTCTKNIQTQLILRALHGDPGVYQELASRWRFKNIR